MKYLLIAPMILLFSCASTQEKSDKKENEKTDTGKTATEIELEKERQGMHDVTRPLGFSTISVDDFEKQMESPCTVLDVRTPEEVAEGIIPNAIVMNINDADFEQQITKLDISKPVCVYCRSGKRSENAANMLSSLGYTVYNLDGGIIAWTDAGKATTK